MQRGLFITIEGPDGAGKSTQIDFIRKYFKDKNIETIFTREPGGSKIGEKIREIILDKNNAEMSYMTEAFLYAAARAQHVEETILPALKKNISVVCDRFIDSSIAYQGYGRNLGDCVEEINKYAIGNCIPDLTILLKIDADKGINRISKGENSREKDRLECESSQFHNKVYNGYLELEKKYKDRIVGIDASQSIDDVSDDIRIKLDELLSKKNKL